MIAESSKVVRTGWTQHPPLRFGRLDRFQPCSGTAFSPQRPAMTAGVAGRCLDSALLHDFSVQREVEPFPLDVLRHAGTDEHLDREKDDQADDGVINENGGHADALVEE